MTQLTDINGTYTLDPAHSRLGFVTRHAMITKVRGSFNEFEGTASADEGFTNARVELTAQVASIDTRNGDRDGHLRSGDFFDVENYPTLRFVSTEITPAGDGIAVTGDLTIKDVTQPISFELEFTGEAVDPFGNTRIGFEGSTQVNRKDFGLTWNAALETGGVLVSEKVTLEFEISAIKNA